MDCPNFRGRSIWARLQRIQKETKIHEWTSSCSHPPSKPCRCSTHSLLNSPKGFWVRPMEKECRRSRLSNFVSRGRILSDFVESAVCTIFSQNLFIRQLIIYFMKSIKFLSFPRLQFLQIIFCSLGGWLLSTVFGLANLNLLSVSTAFIRLIFFIAFL